MRDEVRSLIELGPFPSEASATQEDVRLRQELLGRLDRPDGGRGIPTKPLGEERVDALVFSISCARHVSAGGGADATVRVVLCERLQQLSLAVASQDHEQQAPDPRRRRNERRLGQLWVRLRAESQPQRPSRPRPFDRLALM
jgi:hypothetical protein